MADKPAKPSRLAEHDSALGNLLESLLADVPEFKHEVSTPVPPPAVPAEKQVTLEVLDKPSETTTTAVPVKTPLNPREEAPLTNDEPGGFEEHTEVPEWAREPFRVLLFRVGELRFAMPLILMRSVTPMPDRLTHVPGQPAWHLGVARYRDESVVVADVGSLLGVKAACVKPSHLLVIGDGREAISCDGVEEAIAITADDVRWRHLSGQPWLRGLLVDQMCGLLDAEVIGRKIRHG